MRRAVVLAVLLVLALSGVAQAKPPVSMLTGNYTYLTPSGAWREVTVSARATDPAVGSWTWSMDGATYSGPVTCLRIVGDDAWLAGPATSWSDGDGAVFMWVHDGGNPGTAGDTAFTWGSDPGETLATMEALCESQSTSPYGFDRFPVISGNLNIRLAR
jgi:hypothetical protein